MPPRPSATNCRGLIHLLAWVAAGSLLWLAVLPRIGQVEQVRTMIDRNERLGIDPSAKFYTELPLIDRHLVAIERPDATAERHTP